MTPTECRRETEIVDAIAAGEWPDAVPGELREHAATCPVCADLALAASALHDESAAEPAMALPSAGQVWWRAELRARHEAALMAQRPMIAVQVVAAVVVFAAAVSGIRRFAPELWGWLLGLVTTARSATATGSETLALAIVLSIGVSVLIAPLAIYLVFRADRQDGR